MKSRYLNSELIEKKTSSHVRIIVLTGARQTGKTTLAKRVFKEYSYLSIEDPILRMDYKKLTAAQWKMFYPKAVLDEVQKEPVLIESIKSTYDQYDDVRYLLLGSSQLLLLNKVRESLAGRCIIKEVFPLSLPEIRSTSWDDKVKNSWFQTFLLETNIPDVLPSFNLYPDFAERQNVFQYYLQFGGYPALVHEEMTDDDRDEWLLNYVRTYLERDIRDIADFKSLEPFVKTQQLTALRTGQLINFTNIANEANITSKTAQRFLQYLGVSYQTIMIQAWSVNKLKRLVKTPKLHYLDPGIQRAILQKKGLLNGNEFESAIVSEIYKQVQLLNKKVSFYHLRTHDGAEVDLIMETEEGFIAFEVKQSNHISRKDIRHLMKLPMILDKPVLMSFILSNDIEIKQLDKSIWALPAAMFLT